MFEKQGNRDSKQEPFSTLVSQVIELVLIRTVNKKIFLGVNIPPVSLLFVKHFIMTYKRLISLSATSFLVKGRKCRVIFLADSSVHLFLN